MDMTTLQIRTDNELDALIQALLTAAGHEIYAESTEQTPAENLLCRANAVRDDLAYDRAAAEAAGPEPDFPTGPTPVAGEPLP
jgi:hypothetical protein